MVRNIIKYVVLILVIIGIVLVMKNLFESDAKFTEKTLPNNSEKIGYYSVSISLIDKESEGFVTGANLVLKDINGNVISGWTTEEGVRLVTNLKNGTYTLVEEKAPEGYHLNEEGVTFKIKDKDQEVKMYNSKMTAEENSSANNNETNSGSNGTTNSSSNKTTNGSSNSNNSSSSSNSKTNGGSKVTGSEVGVESTGTSKNILTYLIGIIGVVSGSVILFKTKENN